MDIEFTFFEYLWFLKFELSSLQAIDFDSQESLTQVITLANEKHDQFLVEYANEPRLCHLAGEYLKFIESFIEKIISQKIKLKKTKKTFIKYLKRK